MAVYALHDSDEKLQRQGAFKIEQSQAQDLNAQGYGIHWTPNTFIGSRKKENLDKVRFWFVDMDDGHKEDMYNKLITAPLKPNAIIETKRGYHAYWTATDATAKNFRAVQSALIDRFGGDAACKDVARMLRMPGYYHMKDPDNPFLVETIHTETVEYKEAIMLMCYQSVKAQRPKPKFSRLNGEDLLDENQWDRLFGLTRIGNGNRNAELARISFWLRDAGHTQSVTMNTIRRINEKLTEPLDDFELQTIVRSKF